MYVFIYSNPHSLTNLVIHLNELFQLKSKLNSPEIPKTISDAFSIPNVHLENSLSEAVQCMERLAHLQDRVQTLLTEFPENDVLSQIVEFINRFELNSLKTPLIILAAGLERILGKLS